MKKFDKLDKIKMARRVALTLAALCALVTFAACKHSTDDDSGKTTYYTVTFEANGGSDVPAQTVGSGTTATEPAAPK
ncbi:MAG: InlB B-repeat-containing protein [Treponema sp.]|nr:InlB B-repeat-containing protein [Treponema sp.]